MVKITNIDQKIIDRNGMYITHIFINDRSLSINFD